MKPVIAVDIDDVLGSQNEAVMHFANERYGLNMTLEDYSVEGPYWGYWENIWGVSEEEAEGRLRAFHEAEGTMKQELLPHALEVIRELEKSYELIIITARDDSFTEITHKWLNKHFLDVFSQVRFAQIWHGNKKETKAEICKKIGAGYLIDDNLQHCTLAAELGVAGLLFGRYGWNRADVLPEHVTRVDDWLAVKEYFDGQPG